MDSAHPGGGTADEEGVSVIAAMTHWRGDPVLDHLRKAAVALALVWVVAWPPGVAHAAEPTEATWKALELHMESERSTAEAAREAKGRALLERKRVKAAEIR